MDEADAYKIAADILHPFENRIDVSIGQTLADRIVVALLKVSQEMYENDEEEGWMNCGFELDIYNERVCGEE